MTLRKVTALGLVALLLALVMVPSAFAQGNARVRVLHASPDAPAVDVYVDGTQTLTNVPFFTASDYLELPAGTYRVQVTPTGAPVSDAVIDANATIEAGMAYTIAATGPVASIQPTIIVDNLSAPASGQAKVRVYHLSPDAPAVDIKLADGTTLISGLAFPNASDYLEVPAGSYDIQVTPAGASDVVIDLAGTSLAAGRIYSVFATNTVANITPELAATDPVATTSAAPTSLPNTAAGDGAPLATFLALAVVLLAAGALLVRRRAA